MLRVQNQTKPKIQEREKIMRVTGTNSETDHLCNYCSNKFETCPSAAHLKFGSGAGNDNVIECSEFCIKYIYGSYPIVGKPELGIFPRGIPQAKFKKGGKVT